jgi:hypothetical protein
MFLPLLFQITFGHLVLKSVALVMPWLIAEETDIPFALLSISTLLLNSTAASASRGFSTGQNGVTARKKLRSRISKCQC